MVPPTACHQPPATNRLPPTTCYQPPAANKSDSSKFFLFCNVAEGDLSRRVEVFLVSGCLISGPVVSALEYDAVRADNCRPPVK